MDKSKRGREHFKAQGKLFECPNPPHDFQCWSVIGSWRWAKQSWSRITESGDLATDYLRCSLTETPSGLKYVTIILWKLKILLAI